MIWRSLSSRSKLGLVLIVTAHIFLGLLLLIPFLEADLSAKGILSAVFFILGEVLFYGGIFLLGKDVAGKYRRYFNLKQWLRKKNKADEDNG